MQSNYPYAPGAAVCTVFKLTVLVYPEFFFLNLAFTRGSAYLNGRLTLRLKVVGNFRFSVQLIWSSKLSTSGGVTNVWTDIQ